MGFNWLYTAWNDNAYILFFIIIILLLIIINFKLLKRKSTFDDITTTTTNTSTTTIPTTTNTSTTTTPITTNTSTTTIPTTTNTSTTTTSTTTNTSTTTIPTTTNTSTTTIPTTTLAMNNLFITDDEKNKWNNGWMRLDGNQETISSNVSVQNDILQLDSTLYTPNFPSSNILANIANYAEKGNWATIDDLGKTMTDTLGGINSNLGYTLLTEQLGTFKPNYANPNVYDNTQNYKTGINTNTLSGASLQGTGYGYHQVGKSPIFMQKDFAGVANIFAPNIYVNNSPLNGNEIPDISFTNGDGNIYSV